MVSNKVMIGIITGEYARRADFYDYYNLLIKPEGSVVLFCHDRSPAKGRNLIIEAAQQMNCTHILFIDDDMGYKPDSLNKLLERDVDIVSGLYLSRVYPHQPVIFDLADDDGAAFPMFLTPDKKGLVPIVAAGLGFCLVKMSVFDKMEKPYVRLGELNVEHWCDDIGFFNRVRKAGIQSYCDLYVPVGHMGSMIIWPELTELNGWVTKYDTGGTGAIATPQFQSIPEYEFKDK